MSSTFAYAVVGIWLVISLWEVLTGHDATDTVLLMTIWLAYAKGCEILEVLRGGK